MKPAFLIISLFFSLYTQAQNLGSLLNTVENTIKNKNASTDSSLHKPTTVKNLSNSDIAAGLKEALQVGTERGTAKLSAVDGFFKNAAIKILMPSEAEKIEKTLRSIGLNKQVDDAVLSMNRAAEDAAKSATPIFKNAIQHITFSDAVGILKGGDSAATKYLKEKTNPQLTTAFTPIVQQSLQKVDATKYWETLITAYNKIPFVKKVTTNLTTYVTEKSLSGIFYQVAAEEQKIRKNPLAQSSDLLKKVFRK